MNYQHKEEIVPNAWWSELPADILGTITDKLLSLSLSEFIRFGSVCVEWRSFSIENYQHIKLPNKLPVLLIPIPPSHHKKETPFPLSSSTEEEEEEGKEVEKKETPFPLSSSSEEEKEEGKEVEKKETPFPLSSSSKVEEKEKEKEKEKDEDEDEDEDEEEEDGDEEDEDEDEVCEGSKVEDYYNPEEIWQEQDSKQRYKNTRTFYSLSEKMVYHDFQLPVPYYKNIRGSNHGWLVTVEECWNDNGEANFPVLLLNPFRTYNREIKLPPLTDGNPGNLDIGERIYSSYFLQKAYLSANPSSLSDPTTQLVVLGVYGFNRLAFCRPGDKAWTRLDLEEYRPIHDIICYKGQFYAILQYGYAFAFVFDATQLHPTPIVTREVLAPFKDGYFGTARAYLVESRDDLLQVRRIVGRPTLKNSGRPTPKEDSGYITLQFVVYKLDLSGEWVEIKTLNDRMLFIGTSSSISLSATDFPGWSRPNSIYYTDDNSTGFVTDPLDGPHDMGIFNLQDGSFERHYEAESKTIMPPPIWIQPML